MYRWPCTAATCFDGRSRQVGDTVKNTCLLEAVENHGEIRIGCEQRGLSTRAFQRRFSIKKIICAALWSEDIIRT